MYFWVIALAVATVAADQLTKAWATASLSPGEVIPVIDHLITFRLTYNPGAAFSIGANATWIFTIIAAVAVVAVAWMARKVGSKMWVVALGLLLGGATTHLLDRLFRAPGFARGHVVDFIDYGYFVGNVADIALTVGAVLIVVASLRKIRIDGTRYID